MKSLNAVHEGVEKASKVSPRQGKWATPKEIDLKTSPKQPSLQSMLTELVKDSRIEKKSGMLLYRPQQGAGGGTGAGKSGEHGKDKGKERGKDKGKGKPHRPPPHKKPGNDGRRHGKPIRHDRPPRPRKPEGDPERERRRKIDEMRRQEKIRRGRNSRSVSKTIARGVATRAVGQGLASGVGQSVSRNITTSILM